MDISKFDKELTRLKEIERSEKDLRAGVKAHRDHRILQYNEQEKLHKPIIDAIGNIPFGAMIRGGSLTHIEMQITPISIDQYV